MRIQHNIMAMNAYRNYNKNTSALAKNLEKLSSGYKINRAGDDAAGLAISEKMRAQITGLEAAQKNVKDGISLVNTSEGAMQEIQDMLNRMVYLSTQSANGTYDNEVDRKNLQQEVDQLRDEINRIADSANFNGIKLLDGSLDADSTANTSAASAISNIQNSAYAANGAAQAFDFNYITNRPPASTAQTNAEFTISFDDINVDAVATGTNKVTIKIGDATLTVANTGSAGAMNGAKIASKILTAGKKQGTAVKCGNTNNTSATKASKGTTAAWDAGIGSDGGAFVKINGHWYEMTAGTAGANTVKFTQVDYTGENGEIVHPDFGVSVAKDAAGGKVNGTPNWQVQKPVTGTGVGSSHQAQVSVDLDFSKLKNGDKLTVGDMNYYFKLDAADTTTSAGATAVIDLSTIFTKESDFADAVKQAEAMVSITNQIGATVANSTGTLTPAANKNDTWSVGNGGVSGGIGTLTFQSLSNYKGDSAGAAAADKVNIGNGTNNPVCSMLTEADVMKQFYAESQESAASTSFELDVTKIKEGDTITINGTTFEFTDGTNVSDKKNIAVNLHAYGIAGTISSSNTGNIMNDLKNAITNNMKYGATNMFDIEVDGNKMTLTSNDNAGTTAFDEQRVAAEIKLPAGAYEGAALTLQIGDTSDKFNQLEVSIQDMHTKALGIDDINIGTADGAKAAINVIKDAINNVSAVRGKLGAISNRLDHTANNLSVMRENIQDAESSIRDTDVAEEMMSYTKNNILVQSAQAMLAQANQVPQGVLQLLQ